MLKASVKAQKITIAGNCRYLADNAPAFKQALKDLVGMRAQLQSATNQDVAQDEANALTGKRLAGSGEDYVERYREFKYQKTMFDLFAKRYEIAQVDEAREGAVIQLVDSALAPDHKSRPKKAFMAVLFALAAGFALLLFVFTRQAWRNDAQTPASAEKLDGLRSTWAKTLGWA
jgi:uncharacterized protein involved in exopolysaccharide biosynthesis